MRFNLPLLALITVSAAGQSPVYPGEAEVSAARAFVQLHRESIDEVLSCEFGLDPDLAIAIALPEIVNYSRLRDIAETSALQVFYIQLGDDYANFSIGRLQMKPSFAEALEGIARTLPDFSHDEFEYKLQTRSEIREARVDRLCDVKWQLRYLGLFCRAIQNQLKLPLDEKSLATYAGAYNLGVDSLLKQILTWNEIHNFPSGRHQTSDVSYSSAAVSYYQFLKTPNDHEE